MMKKLFQGDAKNDGDDHFIDNDDDDDGGSGGSSDVDDNFKVAWQL